MAIDVAIDVSVARLKEFVTMGYRISTKVGECHVAVDLHATCPDLVFVMTIDYCNKHITLVDSA